MCLSSRVRETLLLHELHQKYSVSTHTHTHTHTHTPVCIHQHKLMPYLKTNDAHSTTQTCAPEYDGILPNDVCIVQHAHNVRKQLQQAVVLIALHLEVSARVCVCACVCVCMCVCVCVRACFLSERSSLKALHLEISVCVCACVCVRVCVS